MRCALYRLATPVKYIWRRGGEVKTGVLEEDGILHVFMREFEFPSSDCIVFSSGTNIIRCLDTMLVRDREIPQGREWWGHFCDYIKWSPLHKSSTAFLSAPGEEIKSTQSPIVGDTM